MVKIVYLIFILIIIIVSFSFTIKYQIQLFSYLSYRDRNLQNIISYQNNLESKLRNWNCDLNRTNHQKYFEYYNFSNVVYRSDFLPKNNSKSKCAIIGMIYDYPVTATKIFINSLNYSNYMGEIFFMVNENISREEVDYYRRNNIELIFISEEYPYYSNRTLKYPIEDSVLKRNVKILECKGKMKLILIRYLIALSFFQTYKSIFGYILFTDTRDVHFQVDPFMFDIKRGITIFEETRLKTWKNSGFKVNLYRTTKEYIDNVLSYPIINCGVIYMTVNEGIKFLELFKFLVFNSTNNCPNDQSIVNIIVYALRKKFKVFIYPNGFGPVKTMANERNEFKCATPKDINTSPKGNIHINMRNEVVSIGGKVFLLIHANNIWMSYPEVKDIRKVYF